MANTSILAAFERMWLHVLAALGGKADTSHTHNYAASESEGGAANSAYAKQPIVTAGTGAAYTATVPGITALTKGVSFVMVPHVVSTTTQPTLNVNGLGAKGIRRRLSNISTTVQNGYSNNWLGKEQPFTVTYNGTYWIVEGNIKTAAVDLYGQVAVANGGTGATDAATALSNLGGVPANTYTDDWVGFGTDQFTVEIGGGDITFTGGDGEGAYVYCENGDGTLMFYGTAGDSPVRLENIATPVDNRDAANKEYVDGKFASGITSGLYATGLYVGMQEYADKPIEVGFTPKILIIQETSIEGDTSTTTMIGSFYIHPSGVNYDGGYLAVEFTETGFIIHGEMTTDMDGQDLLLNPFDNMDTAYRWVAIG